MESDQKESQKPWERLNVSFKKVFRKILDVFSVALSIAVLAGAIFGAYTYGNYSGYSLGYQEGTSDVIDQIMTETPEPIVTSTEPPASTPTPVPRRVVNPRQTSWGGPELWEAVNQKRVAYGVNPLQKSDELCTIASIRLNELLALGTLDGHAGFSNMPQRRPDLKWIFDKYAIAEFLVAGASSPQEAVSLWDRTMGHKKLLTGGEYVWGCIYAQDTFGVAIAAFQ